MMCYGTEIDCVKFWGQKVTVQGHGGITRWNRHCTGGGIQYSTSRVELGLSSFLTDIKSVQHVLNHQRTYVVCL